MKLFIFLLGQTCFKLVPISLVLCFLLRLMNIFFCVLLIICFFANQCQNDFNFEMKSQNHPEIFKFSHFMWNCSWMPLGLVCFDIPTTLCSHVAGPLISLSSPCSVDSNNRCVLCSWSSSCRI